MNRRGESHPERTWGTPAELRLALERLSLAEELTLARAEPGEALDALCRLAADTSGASRTLILVRESDRDQLLCAGSQGLEDCEDRPALLRCARGLGTWVCQTGQPLEVEEPSRDPRFEEVPCPGITRARAVPLRAYGSTLGALVLAWTGSEACRTPKGWLGIVAHHVELAVLNWQLHREARQVRERLEESEGMRLRAQRTAAAAELAAEMAEEIEGSLGSLKDLLIRVSAQLGEEDPHRTAMELMFQQVTHLERLMEQQIDLTRHRGPRFDPSDLNDLLEEALRGIDATVEAKRLRVTKRLAYSLPELLVDARMVREMLSNVLQSAARRAPVGGRMKVETKRRGETVEIWVAADGEREPGRVLDELWKPFAPGTGSGGFSMDSLRQLLERHRGAVEVGSDRDWPVILRLRLPIPGNRDRRRAAGDRRTGRDRRAA